MRRIVLALVAALALPPGGHSEESGRARDPGANEAAIPGGAPIRVTINPEGRVSVTLEGPLPATAPCGTPIVLGIRILNQGFVTGRLEARLVGVPPPNARLDFRPEPLKGVPHEMRVLRIVLTRAGPTDLTIAFRLHDEMPDLGGRDRIHLLMRGG